MARAARNLCCGLAALLVVAACGDRTPTRAEQQRSIEDAVYVLPTDVPAGWTVGVATQRVERGEVPGGDVVRFEDYTVLWVPEEKAGRDRSDVGEGGPRFWINVGSRYYEDVYWPALAGGSGSSAPTVREYTNATPISRDGDVSELVFRVDCCLVSLSATAMSDDALRSIAASMTSLELHEWRSELGARLLIDDQT